MSELRAGALVQHEDGRAGVLVEGPIGWAVRINGAVGSFAWRGALEDHGWSLVGETGFAPEGARLVYRTVDELEREARSSLEYDETDFVCLHPAVRLRDAVLVEGEEK